MVVGALVLCSFGIYLGRFRRLNSWDVFDQPHELVINPVAHPGALAIVVAFAALLSSMFAALLGLMSLRERAR